MKLTVFRQDYRYKSSGVREYIGETLIFEAESQTPAWKCHFDPQTKVLRVIDHGGDVRAAIARVDYFHVGDITVDRTKTEETP